MKKAILYVIVFAAIQMGASSIVMALWKIIPPEEGSDFCHRLVYHGRDVCTARTKPYCDKCCLADIWPKIGV